MKKLISICLALTALTALAVTNPFFSSGLSATATLVSAAPATVYGWNISNPNASIEYVQIYNAKAAADVTVGTTAPIMSLAIPATSVSQGLQTNGAPRFGTGIVVAATTTATGGSAPVTALVVNLFVQ